MNLNERVAALRAEMEKIGADMYMVTTEDAYLAESACDYWCTLRWLSGFGGTLAYALVTQKKFAFFTDARYIATAESVVKVDGVELYDVTEAGADFYLEWIEKTIRESGKNSAVFGVDGRTLTTARKELIEAALGRCGARLVCDVDIVGRAWPDRPAPVFKPIFDHILKYAGRSREEKIKAVRDEMVSRGCGYYIVGTMEGVVWLTNMRGRDIVNPLFMSHALFTPDSVKLFVKIEMIPEKLLHALENAGYELFDIDLAPDEIKKIPRGSSVFYDVYRTNSLLSSSIPESAALVRGFDIINDLKAVKNDVEIENLRITNRIECAALVRFFKLLKENAARKSYDEYQLTGILDEIHRRSPEFLCNGNFPTMFGYMENGAKPHYSPSPETAATVKPEGVMVIDVLSHYYGGTTDITRTIKLGSCPKYDAEIRRDYTLVLKSMMAVSRQIFRKGADGACIDSVARSIQWNNHMHYGYGTGHGIGYCICAHEGPQFIAEPSYKKEWAFCYLPLKAGNVMANEPGVYKEGRYGIRIEDNLVIVEDCRNEFGEWLKFDTLSYCPFEPELIDTSLLNDDELEWLNRYNERTYEALSPLLDEGERAWLKKMTPTMTK
ncbi:MAG: M24 family metallopeptidase [Synergistaceae bacterium]|jgi:Xaa-Pro aminopeptidase|nr:M24 family metallopeptidase [Synergistaceae bacterium]